MTCCSATVRRSSQSRQDQRLRGLPALRGASLDLLRLEAGGRAQRPGDVAAARATTAEDAQSAQPPPALCARTSRASRMIFSSAFLTARSLIPSSAAISGRLRPDAQRAKTWRRWSVSDDATFSARRPSSESSSSAIRSSAGPVRRPRPPDHDIGGIGGGGPALCVQLVEHRPVGDGAKPGVGTPGIGDAGRIVEERQASRLHRFLHRLPGGAVLSAALMPEAFRIVGIANRAVVPRKPWRACNTSQHTGISWTDWHLPGFLLRVPPGSHRLI